MENLQNLMHGKGECGMRDLRDGLSQPPRARQAVGAGRAAVVENLTIHPTLVRMNGIQLNQGRMNGSNSPPDCKASKYRVFMSAWSGSDWRFCHAVASLPLGVIGIE